MQEDIVAEGAWCKNGSIHLCSEAECDVAVLEYDFPKWYSMPNIGFIRKYEIIGEINHFSEYVTIGAYFDILISQKIMYLS